MNLSVAASNRRLCSLALSTLVCPIVAVAQPPGETEAGKNAEDVAPVPAETWAKKTDGPSPITSAQAAIDRAQLLLGEDSAQVRAPKAEKVRQSADNTPFLSGRVVGRSLWRVTVEECVLDLPSVPSHVTVPARTYDVYLNPADGAVVKIMSRWPTGEPITVREPDAEQGTEELRKCTETYHEFGITPPAVTLQRALDIVVQRGFGDPVSAKQIVARYVVWSEPGFYKGTTPRAIWAITFQGIPQLKPPPPGGRFDLLNHLRHLIDAQTGEWLSASTSPQRTSSGDEKPGATKRQTTKPAESTKGE